MDVTFVNETKFLKRIENLKLEGDDVISAGRFYDIIDDALRGSHTMTFSPLPRIEDLSAGDTIKNHILSKFPQRSHIYSDAKDYIYHIGLVIGGYLNGPKKDEIFAETRCPKTRLAVDILGSTKDGFEILDAAFREIFPKLGADVDLTIYVTNLSIFQGDTLMNYIRRVQRAEEITTIGGTNLAPNQLFERCSLLLNSCQEITPWMVTINHEWNQHRLDHFGKVFKKKVAEYLMNRFRAAKANLEVTLVSRLAKARRPAGKPRMGRSNLRSSRRQSEFYSDNDADKNEQLVNSPRKAVSFKPTVRRIDATDRYTCESERDNIPDLGSH